MYRIMLVDDEPLILAGIASMISWEEYGFKIVGKVLNGQCALELIDEVKPDIIITDIKMPAMDGITFMKEARNQGCKAAFILLTNLEEFQLAREALHLGAVDYLVKLELTEEKLLECLERAGEQINSSSAEYKELSDMTAAEAIKSYFQSVLINETEPKIEESFKKIIAQRFQQPVVMMVHFNYSSYELTETYTREEQKKNLAFAEEILTQMIQSFFESYCILRQEQNGFIFIIEVSREQYPSELQHLSEKISTILHDYFEAVISVSISRLGESVEECKELLYQAMAGMNHYYYDSSRTILFYTEAFEADKRHTSNFNISFLKKDIRMAIHGNDDEKFTEIMREIISLLKEYKPSKLQAVNACTNLYYFITSFFENEEESIFPYTMNIMEKLNHTSSMEGVIIWITQFSQRVATLLKERNEAGTDRYVELARQYVHKHLKDKISLAQVAESLGISQGYLSSTFKRIVGKSFTDFVTEEKIEKAKEMISMHQYMMYEISDELGFDNQYYFSTVFKKLTGCSPREYETQLFMKKKE